MYDFIYGNIAHKTPTTVTIETNGIGYKIYIPLSTFEKITDKENTKLYTKLTIKDDEGKVKAEFHCNHCRSMLTKKAMERAWTTFYDLEINETVKVHKTVPVLINYKLNRTSINKKPTTDDLKLIDKIKD